MHRNQNGKSWDLSKRCSSHWRGRQLGEELRGPLSQFLPAQRHIKTVYRPNIQCLKSECCVHGTLPILSG